VGDVIHPTHGAPTGHDHELGFTIVGVMNPTGTPNDRAAFVNLEGFYLMDGHAKPIENDEADATATANSETETEDPAADIDAESEVEATDYKLISIPQREVTSILVRNGNMMFGPGMQVAINEGIRAQAVAPIGEINKLMDAIVGPLLTALLLITLITCFVAAVGILVAIYNSMNDRRRDIAVMRALGARRETVTTIIVIESFLVAIIGAALGWVLAHGAIALYSERIEQQTGVRVGFFSTSNYELLILPLILTLSLIAALLPAFSAYRTDVASNLQK
jgi:putative ABC transport system permease protein